MAIRLDLLSGTAVTGAALQWPGGIGMYACAGGFSGAHVKLQMLGPDGTTYIDVSADTSMNSAGMTLFTLPRCTVRAAVTGGSPSGLYAIAVGV